MLERFKEVYQYRQMLRSMVLTDLRTRYKGSLLGFLWTFINPLLMLVIYSFVFSTVMRMNIENYPMFLFVAILPWIFFQSSLQNSSGVILRNNSLVKKIYFPREILPMSVVIGGVINYIFGMMILIPALSFYGITIKAVILFFPIILLIQFIITLGLSFIVAALNVFFRDLEHVLAIVLQVGFYVTPIIFPITMVPDKYQVYFYFNPLSHIFSAYRDILFYGKVPDVTMLIYYFVLGLILLFGGWMLFHKLQKRFAEEI